RQEGLVAEWDGGAGLDTASMNAVAEAVTTSRIALAGIRTATGKLSRERQALAVYLHDDLIQTLTGAVLELDSLRGRMEGDPDDALAALHQDRTEAGRG